MPIRLLTFAVCILLSLSTIILAAGVATHIKHLREVDSISDEQKIARALEIIRTSTQSHHKVLKVLFYGQSITGSGWHKIVLEHWREKYPNTVFVVENRAIGGFPSQWLERTTQQDIEAFYPDLIVFHVYGDHNAYERILRMFRSLTAADIIVQTDHGQTLPEPRCAEGLQFTLRRQPGCTGLGWVHQSQWSDEMSYHKIPGFAKKYGIAVEPQRDWWRDYLLHTHIDPGSLLVDGLHPNAQGKHLIADFFDRYFDDLVERWNGEVEHNVVTILPNASERTSGQETVHFDGSRIEMLTDEPLATWPTVTIDDESPKHIDGCYQVTRASSIGTVPDWPALRRIELQHDHTPEHWTATLTKISPDQKTFDFVLTGSITGNDGSGKAAEDFVSKSSQLKIRADDWMVKRSFDLTHTPIRPPFEVHWDVNFVCGDYAQDVNLGGETKQYRYVLATGLSNRKHILKLSAPVKLMSDISEFRVYKPPLSGH